MNSNTKISANSKRLKAALLYSGLTLVATGTKADIINLDFTLYTTQTYVDNTSIDYGNNPLVSDFHISLNTSTLNNTATTNAYNNNPNYTETVTTSVTDGQNQSLYQFPYSYTNVAISQVYSQNQTAQGLSSLMSLGGNFNVNSETYPVASQNYTGNLPPSLIPTTGSQADVSIYSYTNINWSNILGANPSFVVYGSASLTNLFDTMIGSSLNFSQNKASSLCAQPTSYGCAGITTPLDNNQAYGNAVLFAVTINPTITSAAAVPIPPTAWLFASGMGLLRFNQRRKSVR